MKRIVFIILLAALLVSTAGATVGGAVSQKTALSCEPPAVAPTIGSRFDITGILTAGTSSTPVPHRLVTVYNTSADGRKWTAAGFAYTDDTGQYTVTTSQRTRGIYHYKAVFEGDKVFKKSHLADGTGNGHRSQLRLPPAGVWNNAPESWLVYK